MHETGSIVFGLIGPVASATIDAATHAASAPIRLIPVPLVIVAIWTGPVRLSRRLLWAAERIAAIFARITFTLSIVRIVVIIVVIIIISIALTVVIVVVVVARHSVVIAIVVFVTCTALLITIRIVFAHFFHTNSSNFLQFIFAGAIFRSTSQSL